VSAVNDRHLTLKALDMALARRSPAVGLVHHSDQGSTYASEDYRARLTTHGLTSSMSRRGNCYDNAVMEAFFSTVKNEVGERFASHAEAKAELNRPGFPRGFFPREDGAHGTTEQVSAGVTRACCENGV
jgi:transposase InsO family protein